MLEYLIEKEFKQMLRNIILPVVFVLLPIFMMNMVPRIATQEVKNLKYVAIDNDHSQLSQRMIQKISASSYFSLVEVPSSYQEAETYIKSGDADIILEIQPDFENSLMTNGTALVQVSANATNGSKSGLGSSYISQIIQSFAIELREERGAANSGMITGAAVAPRFLYNLQLDYKVYMIPALIAMILTLLIGFLPALNIVMEKEKGTIEQINVTPVGRMEFIFSKLIPYWCIGLFILFFSMLLGNAFHGVWPAGNMLTILLLTSLYILVASSLGLIVSNYSDTIQQAALVMFFFLVIFILLSGMLTPVSSMPTWAKIITEINPLRFYIEPMRMIYIKGSSLNEILPYIRHLGIMAAICGIWAIWSYRKSS
ncbi:MAG: ABC transporter permease [Prevotella sp.]|nr:ABC transporter permease [Prevotella sp.]